MSCATKRPRPKDDQRNSASKGNDSALGVIARKRAKVIDDHAPSTPPEVDVATATPNASGDHISNGINCRQSKSDVIEGTDTAKTDGNENNCSDVKRNDAMSPETSRRITQEPAKRKKRLGWGMGLASPRFSDETYQKIDASNTEVVSSKVNVAAATNQSEISNPSPSASVETRTTPGLSNAQNADSHANEGRQTLKPQPKPDHPETVSSRPSEERGNATTAIATTSSVPATAAPPATNTTACDSGAEHTTAHDLSSDAAIKSDGQSATTAYNREESNKPGVQAELHSTRPPSSEPTPGQARSPKHSSHSHKPEELNKSSPQHGEEPLLSKDQILSKIKHLEGEIKKASQNMKNMTRAVRAAEDSEQKSVRSKAETLQIQWPENVFRNLAIDANLVSKIYRQNRATQTKAIVHSRSNHPVLYSKPSESPMWQLNRRTNKENRSQLLKILQERCEKVQQQERRLAVQYTRKKHLWVKKVERWESAHRKPPELEPFSASDMSNAYSTPTRQRGILGRGSNTGSDRGPRSGRDSANSRRRMIVRSDYEQQKILSEIMESEKQRYKFVKNKALIPPMLLSSRDRHYRSFELQNNNLDTTNGSPMCCSARPLHEKCGENCNCPFVVQERAKKLRPWTDVEKCIFVDKFLQFPKDFSKIAKALANRSTKDAVAFYYNTKYSIPYKGLLREQQQRRRQSAIGKSSWEHVRQTLGLLFDTQLAPQQDDDTPASDQDIKAIGRESNQFKSYGHLRAASLAPVKLAENLSNWSFEEQKIFNEFVSVDREETRWTTLRNLLPRKTEEQLKSFYQERYKRSVS